MVLGATSRSRTEKRGTNVVFLVIVVVVVGVQCTQLAERRCVTDEDSSVAKCGARFRFVCGTERPIGEDGVVLYVCVCVTPAACYDRVSRCSNSGQSAVSTTGLTLFAFLDEGEDPVKRSTRDGHHRAIYRKEISSRGDEG